MRRKFILITCVILTSIVGFWGGFTITKFIASPKKDIPQVLDSIKEKPKIIEEVSPVVTVLPEQKTKDKPKVSKCLQPKKEYADESYLDVGQDVSLEDKSYIPSDLILLDSSITVSPVCLKREAGEAVVNMIKEAMADRIRIKVSSGFRDYSTQEIILNRNIKDGNKNASVAVAKPGYSEHQLGTTVDLTGSSVNYATASGKFDGSPEAKWLEEHSYEYGFIMSYPKGKEDITGYMYEPWHYRYVGINYAKEIIESGQTINQFLKAKKI
ncbi:MAG: M15 family metallopeptidase [Patescibacteria group bacterium]